MNQTMTTPAQPWYREPWPWLLMAGPATVIIAGVFTTYLAVTTSDALVEDDYYKQGLAVNQRVERDQHAGDLGLQAELVQGGEGTLIRVFLRGKEGVILPSELTLHIAHPTRGGLDQHVALHADGTGFYSGKLSAPLNGRWHVALESAKGEWRLVGDWNIEKQSTLRLPATVKAVGGSDVHSDNKGR